MDKVIFSLAEQIACVQREIHMREHVYPRWVLARKMSQNKADAELARMKAVLGTLECLQQIATAAAAFEDTQCI